MENSVTRVIDFMGLPGCGKSTVSHLLANKYRVKGYTVIEPSYSLDHSMPKVERMKKKAWISIKWSLGHVCDFVEILRIVKKNKHQGLEFIKEIINVIQKIYYIQEYKDYDMIVFDEGVMQAAISLGVEAEGDVLNNYLKISSLVRVEVKNINIYLNETKDTVLDRMKQRDTNDSRIEKEPDESNKQKMISRFENCCEVLSELCDVNIFCDNKSAESIAGLAYSSIGRTILKRNEIL